jgi:AraC-like DNA-binding protein
MAWGEPEVLSPWQEAAVEKVAWAISDDPVFPPDMETLCAVAGMSPMHLERAFYLSHGVSLKRYVQTERQRRWEQERELEREQRDGGGCACGQGRDVAREWLIAAI